MNILICGASGFIGRHLRASLQEAGHDVRGAVRHPRLNQDIAVDYSNDYNTEIWIPRLKNIDVVINAVGVLRNGPNSLMQRLHCDTPLALFKACSEAKVKRIIHISALGVESGIKAAYFSSRVAAENSLKEISSPIRWLCIRPSVIFGEDGTSARMFRHMAKLPLHLLPMGGNQILQPVHIDDICTAINRWLDDSDAQSKTVNAVGAKPTTMRGMLDSYRTQLGYRSAWHIPIPESLVQFAAKIGDQIPSSPLCSETLTMMEAGNAADASGFAQLLKCDPMSYHEFIR